MQFCKTENMSILEIEKESCKRVNLPVFRDQFWVYKLSIHSFDDCSLTFNEVLDVRHGYKLIFIYQTICKCSSKYISKSISPFLMTNHFQINDNLCKLC